MKNIRKQYEFTVVGAGIAGICAAVSAARQGIRVALINDRSVLGGNASSELGVNINGAANHGKSISVYARETGIIEEIKTALFRHPYNTAAVKDAVLFDLIYRENNIDLYLNTNITEVIVKERRIIEISGYQSGSEIKYTFKSPYYLDSTGDGTVGTLAGASYRMGRAPKEEFHESLAPEKADSYTMGSTMLVDIVRCEEPVKYTPPSFAYRIDEMSFAENLQKNPELLRNITNVTDKWTGCWWIEYGGQCDTVHDNEDITFELRRLMFGMWDYIKNSGKIPNTENLLLKRVAPIGGKRESRRFCGDYILNQNDIDQKTEFEDAVCVGGWSMDDHAPFGIYDSAPATHWYFVPGYYNIPFRCLYSCDIGNLFFAGRDISASHVAMSSTRTMATGGAMGQAVGYAVSLCLKYGITPRVLAKEYFEEYRQLLLENDQTIVGAKENAFPMMVQADSEAAYENNQADGRLSLEYPYALALPSSCGRIDSAEIGIENLSDEEIEYTISLYQGRRIENYYPHDKIKDITVMLPPHYSGYLPVETNVSQMTDKKLYFVFPKSEKVCLYQTQNELTGVVTLINKPSSHTLHNPDYTEWWRNTDCQDINICFQNIKPEQHLYAPANLVDGYTRVYGTPHLWISENNKPQTLRFEADKPVDIDRIHIVLNNRLIEDELSEKNYRHLIKSFELIFLNETGEQLRRISYTNDDFARFIKIPVGQNDVKTILCRLISTHGGKQFEMFAFHVLPF